MIPNNAQNTQQKLGVMFSYLERNYISSLKKRLAFFRKFSLSSARSVSLVACQACSSISLKKKGTARGLMGTKTHLLTNKLLRLL